MNVLFLINYEQEQDRTWVEYTLNVNVDELNCQVNV